MIGCRNPDHSKSGIAAEPHEAETWTSILFEPSDILEIRCLPPKEMAADLSPLKFTWSRTARTCELDPWIRASQLGSLVNRFETFNVEGVRTCWMAMVARSRPLSRSV